MNTFKPIDFESVPEKNGEEPFGWWQKNPPYDEIAKAITHYLSELDSLPMGQLRPCRPHFERTQWWNEERETGKQIEQDDEIDAEVRQVVMVKLYTHEGIHDASGCDGWLATYEFYDIGRMKVVGSRAREAWLKKGVYNARPTRMLKT